MLDGGGDAVRQDATVFIGDNKFGKSHVCCITARRDIRDYLFEFVQAANRNAFGFDVTNQADLQYTVYDAKEQGHYGWHVDVDWSSVQPFDRKLSVTVQLSDPDDYKGGNFEIEGESPPLDDAKKKGSILVFPSYASHQVTPVTSGVRKSLVAWFEGPKWR